MKLIDVTAITGGCRRTFIALVSIIGMFIFGYLQKIDVSNTIASIAIALAATNGAQAVMATKFEKAAKAKKAEIK